MFIVIVLFVAVIIYLLVNTGVSSRLMGGMGVLSSVVVGILTLLGVIKGAT